MTSTTSSSGARQLQPYRRVITRSMTSLVGPRQSAPSSDVAFWCLCARYCYLVFVLVALVSSRFCSALLCSVLFCWPEVKKCLIIIIIWQRRQQMGENNLLSVAAVTQSQSLWPMSCRLQRARSSTLGPAGTFVSWPLLHNPCKVSPAPRCCPGLVSSKSMPMIVQTLSLVVSARWPSSGQNWTSWVSRHNGGTAGADANCDEQFSVSGRLASRQLRA